MRVIARMNVGGPAYHVSLLCGRLDRNRYESLLVHGVTGPGEASFEDLARDEGCVVEVVKTLGPQISPVADLKALVALIRLVRRFRPAVVHTHTAKAGALGRLAAALALRPRPVIVHTYHGHVLEGYFGPVISGAYRLMERLAARISDCLIGVSAATVDDLVRLRVARRDAFRVIPLGLDLARFANLSHASGTAFRSDAGAGAEDVLAVYVGRLVAIKRVDVLLRAVAKLATNAPQLRLAIIGDGELRGELEALTRELGIEDRVSFVGYRTDVEAVVAAADIAVLSSDNEGTPVALIEAAAAGVPAVATNVGGVSDVVTAETGLLVPAGDDEALAEALAVLTADADRRAEMGRRGRAHVLERFSVERLLADIDQLYVELLDRRAAGRA